MVLGTKTVFADASTWSAAPARMQLAGDPQLIPKGKGMLFVPMMSVPHGNEPSYQIFEKNRRLGSASPGSGVLLPPGTYRVLIGSGAISQMIEKTVAVQEGNTTLVKPDWSALVIDVIDQSRTPLSSRARYHATARRATIAAPPPPSPQPEAATRQCQSETMRGIYARWQKVRSTLASFRHSA